jgi:hypothetical protein
MDFVGLRLLALTASIAGGVFIYRGDYHTGLLLLILGQVYSIRADQA